MIFLHLFVRCSPPPSLAFSLSFTLSCFSSAFLLLSSSNLPALLFPSSISLLHSFAQFSFSAPSFSFIRSIPPLGSLSTPSHCLSSNFPYSIAFPLMCAFQCRRFQSNLQYPLHSDVTRDITVRIISFIRHSPCNGIIGDIHRSQSACLCILIMFWLKIFFSTIIIYWLLVWHAQHIQHVKSHAISV